MIPGCKFLLANIPSWMINNCPFSGEKCELFLCPWMSLLAFKWGIQQLGTDQTLWNQCCYTSAQITQSLWIYLKAKPTSSHQNRKSSNLLYASSRTSYFIITIFSSSLIWYFKAERLIYPTCTDCNSSEGGSCCSKMLYIDSVMQQTIQYESYNLYWWPTSSSRITEHACFNASSCSVKPQSARPAGHIDYDNDTSLSCIYAHGLHVLWKYIHTLPPSGTHYL